MKHRNIFIDSNIFLNFLLKEEGFFEGSEKLLESVEQGKIVGITTLINLMEVMSILRKYSGGDSALIVKDIEKLGEMENLSVIIPNEIHIAEAYNIQKHVKTMPVDSILVAVAGDFAEIFVTRDKELAKKGQVYLPFCKPEDLVTSI